VTASPDGFAASLDEVTLSPDGFAASLDEVTVSPDGFAASLDEVTVSLDEAWALFAAGGGCVAGVDEYALRFVARYDKTLRKYAAVVAIGCAMLWQGARLGLVNRAVAPTRGPRLGGAASACVRTKNR
jgi:hypothetical protein